MTAQLHLFRILLLAAAWFVSTAGAQTTVQFDLPAQPLADSLRAVASQTNTNVLFDRQLVEGRKAPALKAQLTSTEAVTRLLAGSGLKHRALDDKTIILLSPTEASRSGKPQAEADKTSQLDAPSGVTRVADAELSGSTGKSSGGSQVEEMLVEGEREKPVPFSTANLDLTRTEDDILPFQTFTARDIELSGATNVEEFLRKRLPQFVTDYLPEERNSAGQDMLDATAGAETFGGETSQNHINLRGWGSGSGNSARETVILINGRQLPPRFVANGTDAQMLQGDFRNIPLGSIERIEILSSAGSAIYGGNATSGVINIILRQDYQGGQLTLSYDTTTNGNSPRRSVDMSYSMPVKWDIGVQIQAGLRESVPLRVGDRAQLTGVNEYRALTTLRLNSNPDFSSANPLNIGAMPMVGATPNIQAADPDYYPYALSGDGNQLTTNLFGSAGQSNVTSVPDGYRGGQGIQPFLSRIGVYNYNLSEGAADPIYSSNAPLGDRQRGKSLNFGLSRPFGRHLKLSVDYSYSNSETTPEALYFFGSFGTSQGVAVPASAPTNPFGVNVVVNFDDPRMRRPEVRKGFGSISQGMSATLHANFGEWRGVADASYSKNTTVWDNAYFYAPIGGWLNAMQTGAYDPFVDMRVVAPAAASFYETFVMHINGGESVSDYRQAAARVSGPLFRMPAGLVQLTGGLGWSRSNRIKATRQLMYVNSSTGARVPYIDGDPYRETANDGGRPPNPSANMYVFQDYSVYAETTVPVFAPAQGLPLMERLDVFASGRLEYSPREGLRRIGGTVANPIFEPVKYDVRPNTKAFGLRHDVMEGMQLRASHSIGFRPPTMFQVTPSINDSPVAPGNVSGFLFGMTDPRRNNEPVSSMGVVLFLGANNDLLPETSASTNYGLVLQPRWLPGLRFSVDYLESVRNDAITNLQVRDAINYEMELPGRIQRAAAGPDGRPGVITMIDARFINLREIVSRSVDFSIAQSIGDVFSGQLMLTAAASRLLSYRVQLSAAGTRTEQVRRTVAALSQQTSWNGNAQLDWQRNRWTVGWSANYFDTLYRSYTNAPTKKIGWALDHDAFVSYRSPDAAAPRGMRWLLADLSMTFGVKNVFDRKPRHYKEAGENGGPLELVGSDSIIGRSVWLQVRRGF